MREFDLETIAKYPFLKEARDYVSSLNLTLEEILRHPVYSAGVEMGRQRALDALSGEVGISLSDRISQELSILSYVMARIFVNLTGNKRVLFKYATSEAKSAYNFLKNERGEVLQRIREDVDFSLEGDRMYFIQYLRLSKDLTGDPVWRLVNRMMSSGYVEIREGEILILLKEAIKLRIMEPVDVRNVPEEFRLIAKELTILTTGTPQEIKAGDLNKEAVPPCIAKMLFSLERGDTSHNAMFILGTFFTGLGLNVDDVVRIFSVFPRFNEEKTRYQLEFLSGDKGTTRYSCPSCAKIKSYGLCVSECRVKHPLQYYRNNIK